MKKLLLFLALSFSLVAQGQTFTVTSTNIGFTINGYTYPRNSVIIAENSDTSNIVLFHLYTYGAPIPSFFIAPPDSFINGNTGLHFKSWAQFNSFYDTAMGSPSPSVLSNFIKYSDTSSKVSTPASVNTKVYSDTLTFLATKRFVDSGLGAKQNKIDTLVGRTVLDSGLSAVSAGATSVYQVFIDSNIDFLTVAAVPLFTTAAGVKDFHIDHVDIILRYLTGSPSTGVSFSIGYTSTSYNDNLSSGIFGTAIMQYQQVSYYPGTTGSDIALIPPATTEYINITIADGTATVVLVTVITYGEYIN